MESVLKICSFPFTQVYMLSLVFFLYRWELKFLILFPLVLSKSILKKGFGALLPTGIYILMTKAAATIESSSKKSVM